MLISRLTQPNIKLLGKINKMDYFDNFIKYKMTMQEYATYIEKNYFPLDKLSNREKNLYAILDQTTLYNWLEYAHEKNYTSILFENNSVFRDGHYSDEEFSRVVGCECNIMNRYIIIRTPKCPSWKKMSVNNMKYIFHKPISKSFLKITKYFAFFYFFGLIIQNLVRAKIYENPFDYILNFFNLFCLYVCTMQMMNILYHFAFWYSTLYFPSTFNTFSIHPIVLIDLNNRSGLNNQTTNNRYLNRYLNMLQSYIATKNS